MAGWCKRRLQKSKKLTVVKGEDAYRPKLCNFENGDAADPFIEDGCKILALVARYRPTCSVDDK